MITLAFYKGRGRTLFARALDGVIRFVTGGIYSHVELIAGHAELGETAICLSSSGRDGGVREKEITLDPNHWDLVYLPMAAVEPTAFIRARIGQRYDYAALLLAHVLAIGWHNPNKWICSEIIAAALGLPNSHRYSPQLLYDVVGWRFRMAA